MSYASSAIKRLSNEYRRLQKPENRVREYYVAPLSENIFEWHFTLRGPGGDNNSLPYKDGIYHGALLFSRSYPLEPPDIIFFTRSGRFAVHEKICSTISSYHKELWQPTYDVALTLTALRHFMGQEEEFGVGAFPRNMVPLATKEAWARDTWSFRCSTCRAATKDLWETEMKMYPEISPEKEAQVPKLPPTVRETTTSAAATPEDTQQPKDIPEEALSSVPPPVTPPRAALSAPPACRGEATGIASETEDAPRTHRVATEDRQSSVATTSSKTAPSPGASTPTGLAVGNDALHCFTPSGDNDTAHEQTRQRDSRVVEESIHENRTSSATFTSIQASPPLGSGKGTQRPPATEPDHRQDTRHDPLPLEAPRQETMPASISPESVTQRATPSVTNDAVEATGTEMPVSLSTPEAVAAPHLPTAQHIVLGLRCMQVSISLRLIDRSILTSLLLVALILLRRGICGLLMT